MTARPSTNPLDPLRRYWSVPEFSAISGVPVSTIRGWIACGVLPATTIGEAGKRGRTLIPREAAEDKLARGTFGGRAG